MRPEEMIGYLKLRRHPEGGYFRETYRSGGEITAARPGCAIRGTRPFSTAIYFLLAKGDRSRLHRIRSDEIWHLYHGGPLTVAEIAPDGRSRFTKMGTDIKAGQTLQHAVPAGTWFGAYLEEGIEYALAGCTVAPGFDFADFELGDRAALLREFPGARELIERLT